MTTRTFLSIIACKRLLSGGDEEKARMNENIGWVGRGRGKLFTPPLFSNLRSDDFFFFLAEKENRLISDNAFPAGVFRNIGRSAGAEGYYARNNNPCSVGFTLSLWGGERNNGFQV